QTPASVIPLLDGKMRWIGETSPLHSSAMKQAKEKRTLVITPDFANQSGSQNHRRMRAVEVRYTEAANGSIHRIMAGIPQAAKSTPVRILRLCASRRYRRPHHNAPVWQYDTCFRHGL